MLTCKRFAAAGTCMWLLVAALLSPVLATPLAPIDPSSEGQSPPRGELWPTQPLADETFGISTRALALRRSVQMYQWQVETGVDGSVSWSQAWADRRIELPAVLRDETHANPADMPFRGVTWRAAAVELDGQPVDASLYAHFGDWTPLAIDIAALPPNLAASFSSIDGCLHSGSDAAKPAIGDLRICWEILPAGPIEGAVRLEAGRWIADDAPVTRGTQGEDFSLDEYAGGDRGYWLLALLLPGFLVLVWLLRNRGRS